MPEQPGPQPHYADDSVTLYHGDSLTVARELASSSVDCIVTSPPYYGLRDYGVEGQYGLEASPTAYVETMRALFSELRRVLSPDGTLWLNIGDSYSASPPGKSEHAMRTSGLTKPSGNASVMRESVRTAGIDRSKFLPQKNLMGIPWQVAFALQADGWILRNAIVWHKSNAMPEPVKDRLSTTYEMVFMFSKSRKYWFDLDPVREPVVTTHTSAMSWSRDSKEADVPGQQYRQHRKNRPDPKVRGKASGVGVMPTGSQHTAQHAQGRNPGDVWTIPTMPFAAAHFAVMARELAERAIQAGCTPRRCAECGHAPTLLIEHPDRITGTTDCGHDAYRAGIVLDPFSGSGTTGLAAAKHGRGYVGIDLNAEYLDLSLRTRLLQPGLFEQGA